MTHKKSLKIPMKQNRGNINRGVKKPGSMQKPHQHQAQLALQRLSGT